MCIHHIINDHRNSELRDLRLGQYFCIKHISTPWPELFYAKHGAAIRLITEWLKDNELLE